MKLPPALAAVSLLAACSAGGPTADDFKDDAKASPYLEHLRQGCVMVAGRVQDGHYPVATGRPSKGLRTAGYSYGFGAY
jgi:hypothetical protein